VLFGHRRVECMRLAHADDVPLLLLPEDTRCHRCDRLHGNEPRYRRFGPTEAHVVPPTREGRRCRVNQDAFHRCERGAVMRIAPPVLRAGLSLTRPTRYPHGWGQCAHRALQACRTAFVFRRSLMCGTSRSLRCDIERAGSPFQPRIGDGCPSDSCETAPGPDDPSTPPWLGVRGR
jgi:hypothetical protein